MTVIWIIIVGAIILSALIVWSVGETRRHQSRGARSRDLNKRAKEKSRLENKELR